MSELAEVDSGGPGEVGDWELTELTLEVGAVAHGGHCVAHAPDGRVVFVRHALPGERVVALVTEERPGYLRADTVRVLQASAHRVAAPCPYAGDCGGCDFQHADLAYQRQLKAEVVREQLARIGGLGPAHLSTLDITCRELPEVAGEAAGLGWRTRVQYTVDASGRPGLLRHRSHEVVPVRSCLIAHASVRAAPVLGREWGEAAGHAVQTLEVARSTVVAHPGSSIVDGPALVTEQAAGRSWQLRPTAFWQVHPAAADTLAATVVEFLDPRPGERAWDLYGGVGLFAAALAPRLDATGRVTVVEADPVAVATARESLRDLTTVTVVENTVERALANPRWRSTDLVVLDPPRSGAGRSVVEAIAHRGPRAIAYVACDPAAFARDVRTFTALGARLERLRVLDMFPMTHHVECVGLIRTGPLGS